MTENQISTKIIMEANEVHNSSGPGLLEKAYQECLCYKPGKSGLNVVKEKLMPLVFEDVNPECGYRIDLLVENEVIIKEKSVSELDDIDLDQALTCLKSVDYRLGLLINCYVTLLKKGIRRIINGNL